MLTREVLLTVVSGELLTWGGYDGVYKRYPQPSIARVWNRNTKAELWTDPDSLDVEMVLSAPDLARSDRSANFYLGIRRGDYVVYSMAAYAFQVLDVLYDGIVVGDERIDVVTYERSKACVGRDRFKVGFETPYLYKVTEEFMKGLNYQCDTSVWELI